MSEQPAVPQAELDRLQEILELDLTSREVDEILSNITREAAAALDLPISLVSIILDEAQYFAAAHGIGGWIAEARGTPVDWSFCKFAVASKQNFVVEDATSHPLVKESPLVTQDGIRCYFGVPLVTSRGNALGTLCVIGSVPRQFTAAERQTLEMLAQRAVQHLERRAQQRGRRR